MIGCVSLESGIFVADNGQRTTDTGTRGVLRGPRGPKNLPECRLFNSESFTNAEYNTNREFMFCKYAATHYGASSVVNWKLRNCPK